MRINIDKTRLGKKNKDIGKRKRSEKENLFLEGTRRG